MLFNDESPIIEKHIALEYQAVQIADELTIMTIGVIQYLSSSRLRDLEFICERSINQIQIDESEFNERFEEAYKSKPELPSNSALEKDAVSPKGTGDNSRSFSATKPLNEILNMAIRKKVSDIHFQPGEQGLLVRFRIDGDLQLHKRFSLSQQAPMLSRLKIMCDMDIAEMRLPQDSSMQYKYDNQTVDIRVSTLPGSYGEKIVLRILDKTSLILDLNYLGYLPMQIDILTRVLNEKTGIILLTGPTGSGKSTTLYAALAHLNNDAVNILTVEDPIEYQMEGITQTHHRSDIGYTFSAALRSMLRQDPDIIMVGEMRDTETAQIAFRSSLTGHLVLSTLHTNDAIASIHRLGDMGIEPYIISSATRLIISQRLTKRLCPKCKKPAQVDGNLCVTLGLENSQIIYQPVGCDQCNHGYMGRTAISEMLEITERIRHLIEKKASGDALKAAAVSDGFISLRDVAIQKLVGGEIGLENLYDLQLIS